MDESVQKHLTELDEASRLLLKAADLIEMRGLCRKTYVDGDRFCIFGALDFAAGSEPGNGMFSINPALHKAIERVAMAVGRGVATWNDEHTKEEVVAKLRSVALGG